MAEILAMKRRPPTVEREKLQRMADAYKLALHEIAWGLADIAAEEPINGVHPHVWRQVLEATHD